MLDVLELLNQLTDEPLTRDQAQSIIIDSMATVLEVERATITTETALVDLDLDSLVLTELLVEIEERLGIELPEELLEYLDDQDAFETVGDVLIALVGTANIDDAQVHPTEVTRQFDN